MGCNCNNNRCERPSQTACHKCNPAPCQEPQDCSCPTILKTDCSTYSGEDLECSGIKKGTILTELIQQLDAFICKVREDLINAFTLRNIGTGAEVYKGVDLLGRKEIRKINATGDLVSVTQNTDDISIGIDEDALGDFVQDNQKTYSIDNVGTGAEAFKDTTVVGNNTQFNFRSVVKEDLGNGESFLRDIQQNTNELNIRVKTLVSDNLTITSTDDEVRIETPMTASIPALYVNDLYVPSYPEWLAENSFQNGGTPLVGFVFKGRGTLSAPFCDDIVYPLAGGSPTITPNTSIQNSLDGDSAYAIPYSYQGAGTRLNPQRQGQRIIVQNNNSFYTHAGDYNYNYIRIHFQCSVLNTTSNYIIDMDNPAYFNATTSVFEITIDEGFIFQCSDSLGFRNSGTTDTTLPVFSTGRIGFFKGNGAISFSYNGVDILTRYVFNGEGNANNGNIHFQVKTEIRAEKQGIYFSKNKNSIDFYKPVTSGVLNGSGNINLKAFHMEGGRIRFYEEGFIYLADHTSGRIYGVTFEPKAGGIGFCSFQLNSARVAGTSQNCFAKLNNEHVNFLAFNSPSGADFSTTLVGTPTLVDGLFENLGVDKWSIDFKNNVFSYTGIDQTKVDLTQGNSVSTINFIGGSVLENLVVFTSKINAIASGHPYNSAFIKRNVFDAVDLIAGVEYKVVTPGSPSLGAIGDFFTATGSETGGGTASLETREIIT